MVTENMDSKRRASALRRISPCPGLYGSASLSRFFQKLNTLPATALLCLLISVFTAGAMRGASESVQGDCRPGGITVKHTGLSKNGRNHAKGKRETKADGPNMLDTLFWGPEIIVEAKRILPDDEIFNRSNFVVLIDLGKRKDRIEDIASILSRTVGVRVKQYGGLGSFATMSIRGSSSNQVQLYMDGVPLNDAYTGTANLADLPLGDVQRIEIFRGFSPTNFGSSAIGGTVNLVTSGNSDREGDRSLPDIEAQATAGSFGTQRYTLTLRSQIGRVRLHCHGGHMNSSGDFPFNDDNATPENLYDDCITDRANNDFKRWNLTGRIGFDLPGFSSISLNHNMVDRDGGVPGIGTNQSTEARFSRRRHITYLKLKPKAILSNLVHADITTFYSWTAERFSDPGGDINLTKQETDNRIKSYGGNIRSKVYAPLIPVSLEIFFEGRKERYHPVSHLPVTVVGPDRLRTTSTLSVSSDLSILKERLILTAGIRSEWSENEFYDEPLMPWLPPTPQGKVRRNERTPNFGFRFHPASFLTLKGNWGRYYRLPTFFELFGNLGSVTGDNELEHEKGLNRDIGVTFSTGRFLFFDRPFLEAVYLSNEVENLILFFPNSQSTVKPKNIGSATIRGFELSLAFSILESINLSGNYCYLDGKDTSPIPYYNGNSLAGRPLHQAAFQIEFDKTRWRAAYELHYIGSNYLDRANMKELPARKIHNLSLNLRHPGRRVTLAIEAQNLGDNQVSDVSGFPLPGRSFYTTIRLKI